MVLSCSSSAYVWYDAGITVNVDLEGSGSMGNFMGEWKSNSYDYRVAVHSDAKFNLPAGTTQFYRAGTAAKCYSNVWSTATINIDGVEKTVCIANAHTYNTAKFDITSAGLLTVDNGDGTKSAAAVVPTEGATYTTVSGSTNVSDWSFSMATYTDEAGTVHTIYYKDFN
jgi:hypothetical protein